MSCCNLALAIYLLISLQAAADEAKVPAKKKLDLQPVTKPNPKEVRQLPPTNRVCYVGGEQFWIHDDVDEARCAEAGGKSGSAQVNEKKVRNMKAVPTLNPPKREEGSQRQFDPSAPPNP